MHILFISRDFSGASLAHQLVREGHEVRALVYNQAYCLVLTGVVDRVADLDDGLAWVGRDRGSPIVGNPFGCTVTR
jgi:hypothetical protein